MPIYEYVCGACGNAHEALQKISDVPLTDCPACGQSSLKKKVSAPAFRLAGSGWYETDFKTGAKKNLANDSKSDSSGASASATPASSTTSSD
jgi:putative FmdB family regulatory protein